MKFLLACFFLLMPPLSALASDGLLVTRTSGEILRFKDGRFSEPVTPFVQLQQGDRVQLGDAARLTLVVPASASQETWQGSGQIRFGQTGGIPEQGSAQVARKALPEQMAMQIARSPTVDSHGKVGMVRVRSVVTAETLAKLERDYQAFRAQSPAGDKNPELFFLSGLLEIRALDRLEQELQFVKVAYPNDPEVKVIVALYTRAVNNLRQNSKR